MYGDGKAPGLAVAAIVVLVIIVIVVLYKRKQHHDSMVVRGWSFSKIPHAPLLNLQPPP